ncbi:MAG: molybdopterin molybdotransferase MoeA [Flavisolibacter sp.]
MTSVNEAIEKIKVHTGKLLAVKIALRDAAGLVLAEDVYANCNVPNFNQSAMDGYALRYDDLLLTKQFLVAHEIAAGDFTTAAVPSKACIRIFTGAPIPGELDTVVMQEKVDLHGSYINVLDDNLKKGNNVRLLGSEIKKGELALPKNSFLSPAAIGFLASIGTEEVRVYPKPNVHIIVTGKELVPVEEDLKEGQVYESNSLLLQAALKQLHIYNITTDFVGDSLDETIHAIEKALAKADILLLTGGVSVGNYDFVVKAAEVCGINQLFHKVKQRPGKPLYAGTQNNKIVFGLPGNPASVLSCFYNYVVIAIQCMSGRNNLIEKRWFPLATSYNKNVRLTQFLKATTNGETVTPLPAQESFRLSSFSTANCLIILGEENSDFAEGELVETLVLPYL